MSKKSHTENGRTLRLFERRDLDGFFGLFVDNLVQLLLIVGLCSGLCGMRGKDAAFLYQYILPGAAISILFGNLFYAWQARRLAKREGRTDVTALPYGINTPSLLVYVYFVMLPVYQQTGSARAAWQMGLIACLGSGLIEFFGSFVAGGIRRYAPRAALLSALAGIAIGFISMSFALQIWQLPLIALLPLAIILLTYFAKIKFPFGLPGGLVAIVVGTLAAWLLPSEISGKTMSVAVLSDSLATSNLSFPSWAGGEIIDVLAGTKSGVRWLGFLSVIIPMGLFNVMGSLQNLESAEAAGDRFETRSSLAVNGLGTILAAFFGSCFPTTIYIGHPGWKEMGARTGYSTLNGLVIVLICFSGTVSLISNLIPLEACVAIVLWIGVIITAQAFQSTPPAHAPAVALGLFPAIAGWGATLLTGTFVLAGTLAANPEAITIQSVLSSNQATQVNGFLIHGLNIMNQGYIFTCMIVAAIAACLIDRKFGRAAVWSLVASILSFIGLIHAYQIKGNVVDFLFVGMRPAEGALAFPAYALGAAYLVIAVCFGAAAIDQAKNDLIL